MRQRIIAALGALMGVVGLISSPAFSQSLEIHCATSIRFITGVTPAVDTVPLASELPPGEYQITLTAYDEYLTPVDRADTDPATNGSERVRAWQMETEDLEDGVSFASTQVTGNIVATEPIRNVTFLHLSDGNANSVQATLCLTAVERPIPTTTVPPTIPPTTAPPEVAPPPVEVAPPPVEVAPPPVVIVPETPSDPILFCPNPDVQSPTGLVRDCPTGEPEGPISFVEPFECFDRGWIWND